MKKTMSLCGALLLAWPALLMAKDYPLEFKTLTAQQAESFPCGTTIYALVETPKPATVRKTPPAVSRNPLYGQLANGTSQTLCRMDESKGTGKGYDRLIVDVNRNGDLTDDPEVSLISSPTPRAASPTSTQGPFLFGPILGPEDAKIGTNRPICYAQFYLLSVMVSGSSTPSVSPTIGELILRPGCYLEATVEMDGRKHQVDLVDANCNFHLGDEDRPVTSRSSANASETNWSFQGGDRVVVDRGLAANTVSALAAAQSATFAPILYLDAKPYKAALSADSKSLSLEPWTEPLAELDIQPHGEQVTSVNVAWEKSPNNWVLLQPNLENGKAKVPPGNYRLYACNLRAKVASGDTLVLTGTKRIVGSTLKAEAGAAASLKCGAPLTFDLTSTGSTSVVTTSASLLGSLAQSFMGRPAPEQIIRACIIGAGGETYAPPYLMGDKGRTAPPAPVFTVLNADGKQVATGNLEYG